MNIDRETIKRIALEAGFTLREQQGTGRIDLNEYVYDFAARLYAEWAKGSEPAAVVTNDAGGAAFTEANNFGFDLPAGTKLYTRPQPAIQPGWKLVPEEPTEEMVTDGINEHLRHDFLRVDSVYRAMLAAAPEAPKCEP